MSLTLFSFVVSTHIIASDKNAVHENLTHEHLNQFKSFEIRFCLGLATNLPFTHGSESIEPQAWGPYYFHSHWKLLPELTLGSLPLSLSKFIYFNLFSNFGLNSKTCYYSSTSAKLLVFKSKNPYLIISQYDLQIFNFTRCLAKLDLDRVIFYK